MYPNQPPQAPNPNQGYPPQTPQPQPSFGMPQNTPTQPSPYSQQPLQQPPQSPYQPQQQPQPNQTAAWYTPPPKKDDSRPASATDYVQRAQVNRPAGSDAFFSQEQNDSHSIDYLNKIAGTTSVNTGTAPANQKIVLIGVGIFLALALAVFLMIFSKPAGPAGPPPAQILYTTMFNNSQVTKTANKFIKNSKLSSLNSSFNGQLLNDLTAMTGPLAKSGINAKDVEKSAKKAKEFEKTLSKLNDARLNAVYDQAYAREMDYQLRSIVMLMEKIQKTSRSKTMVEFVKNDIQNYKTLQEGLKDYNDTLVSGS